MVGLVILGALFLQSVLAQVSRIAAGVAGYVITTGVLIWGLSVYAESDTSGVFREEHFVTIFGIELSKTVFVLLMVVWYAYDTWHLAMAFREREAVKELLARHPQLENEDVLRFYGTAFNAWANQQLAVAEQPVAGMQLVDFVDKYPPREGTALGQFFDTWEKSGEESLVGADNEWFVLTNLRLIQKDGSDGRFKEVVLADVESLEARDGSLRFRMTQGGDVTVERADAHPDTELLARSISPGESGSEIGGLVQTPQPAPAAGAMVAETVVPPPLATPPLAEPVGGQLVGRPLGQPRGIGFGIFMFIITLTIYGWYWVYKTMEEMKRHVDDGLGGIVGLVVWILLSPVMAFVIPSEIGKMYARDGREKPMTGWTGLWLFPGLYLIVPGIVWFVKVQGALNRYWESKGATA